MIPDVLKIQAQNFFMIRFRHIEETTWMKATKKYLCGKSLSGSANKID